ncbi:copper resistance CopC/CopD family protein [Cytobacillus sp. NCCP-133]|uniref:copper resistance CopC/CopD family protein n=1 Tax=Cytobacillus sp. NCCP-133 TaxID=766848 RepID=UPI0022306553|nr:copper resistance protein CopC [Cytobacillus sp. NCCP-133]GLB61417.1 copper resistance protein [Cytobacillus sp. NCCP-133]
MLVFRNIFTLFIFAFLIQFFIPGSSGFAHSTLQQTYPKEGEKLSESPSSIEMWFQDPVVLHPESIQLDDASGNHINIDKAVVDPDDKSHIIANLTEKLPAGHYVARINVIALDGFVLQEELNFQVVKQKNEEKKEELRILKYSPDDGEIVEGSPQKMDLWFNQPTELTAIGVFDDNQQSIKTEEPFVDPNDPSHIMIEFAEELPKGTYQVTWYARPSTLNGKNQPDILDVFYFAVNEFTPIKQLNMGDPTRSIWFKSMGFKQLGYWLQFIGISILFGSTFFHSAILKRRNSLKWNKLSSVLLLFVILGISIIFIKQKGELESLSLTQLLSLKFVWIPILQIVLLLTGLLFKKAKLFLYGIALLLMTLITGHAAYPRYGGNLSVIVNAVHLLAASIWIGGLFAIITIPKKGEIKELLKDTLPKFSKWALISLIVIIVTGLYMKNQYVPSFSINSFIKSEWGKAIAVKVVVTLIIFIIGFFQRRTIKKLTTNAVNTVLNRARVELVYAALIIFFASLLVVSTPGAAEQGVYPSSIEKENIELNVDFMPLYPGLNVLTMDFGGEEVKSVEVTLSMPPNYNVTYKAFKIDDGVFKITGNLLHAAGTMGMSVKAIKANEEEIEFPFEIVIPGEMRFNE